MANVVDAKIDQVMQGHIAECEKANVSRNVDETARRVKDAIASFTRLEVLASGYWGSLHDQAKVAAIRDAVLELATPKPQPIKAPAPVANDEDEVIEVKKPAKKAKAKA